MIGLGNEFTIYQIIDPENYWECWSEFGCGP